MPEEDVLRFLVLGLATAAVILGTLVATARSREEGLWTNLTFHCAITLKRTVGERDYTDRCGCLVMHVLDETPFWEKVVDVALLREPADLMTVVKVKAAALECNRTGNRWSVR